MTAATLRTSVRLRALLSGISLALLFSGSVCAQPGMPLPNPPSPPPPLEEPMCPMEAIGQSGGMWYYITSNCVDTTGFGQYATYYDSPQCSNGQCLVDPLATYSPGDSLRLPAFRSARPIPASLQVQQAPGGGPGGAQSNTAKDNGRMEVDEALKRLDRTLNNLNSNPKRKARITRLRPFVAKTLEYLSASDVEAPQKAQALQNFRTQLALHEKRWSIVPLAVADRTGFLNDTKPEYVPVSAAATTFELAPGIGNSTTVTVTLDRGPLLKLVQHNPGKPLYFQTFTMVVTPRTGTAFRGRFGVQAAPTPAEIGTSIVVRFSDRGNHAHKVFLERETAGVPGGTTFYLNSVDNLEP